MLKDATHKEKVEWVKEHLPHLIQTVKKDLKNDHLKSDPAFLKAHFAGKAPQKITNEELVAAYYPYLERGDERMWEFVTERWLMKNSDVYYFFEQKLRDVADDFTTLTEIDEVKSKAIANESVEKHGALSTYLFAVLNSVVFPKSVFEDLRKKAKSGEVKEEKREAESIDVLKLQHQQEIARIEDRYEKKLLGLERKYLRDVEGYKKQIATLQRKLNG